jgi:hypothetical protein
MHEIPNADASPILLTQQQVCPPSTSVPVVGVDTLNRDKSGGSSTPPEDPCDAREVKEVKEVKEDDPRLLHRRVFVVVFRSVYVFVYIRHRQVRTI